MRNMHRIVALALVVIVVLSTGVLAAGQQPADEGKAKQESAGQLHAWQLVSRYESARDDASDLAETTLRLSQEQSRKLAELAFQHREQRRQAMAALRASQAADVRKVLGPGQKQRYDAILSALNGLAEKVDAARQKLAGEAADPHKMLMALEDSAAPALDVVRFAGISEEKQDEVLKFRLAAQKALTESSKELPDRKTLKDPEAWRAYREKIRALQEKARADYQKGIKGLLTEAEFERVRRLQQAAEQYSLTVQQAYGDAFNALQAAMTEHNVPEVPADTPELKDTP